MSLVEVRPICFCYNTGTVTGDMDYSGTWNDFNGVATLSWGEDKLIRLSERFSMTDGLSYEGELTNPWYEKIVSSISHSGSWQSWTNEASVTYGERAPYTVSTEFDSSKYYKAKVHFYYATSTMTTGHYISITSYE